MARAVVSYQYNNEERPSTPIKLNVLVYSDAKRKVYFPFFSSIYQRLGKLKLMINYEINL